jgi:hypothetical protein
MTDIVAMEAAIALRNLELVIFLGVVESRRGRDDRHRPALLGAHTRSGRGVRAPSGPAQENSRSPW